MAELKWEMINNGPENIGKQPKKWNLKIGWKLKQRQIGHQFWIPVSFSANFGYSWQLSLFVLMIS